MSMKTQHTILVVDDENGVRQSFNMILNNEFNVLLAGSGQEAIDIFTKKSVDLVLLDLFLPDSNGLELLRRFKHADPKVEIIMVTAVKAIQTAMKATRLGAYEYIVKPFKVDELLNTIHKALEKRNRVK